MINLGLTIGGSLIARYLLSIAVRAGTEDRAGLGFGALGFVALALYDRRSRSRGSP